MLFEKYRIKKALQEFKALKDYGCFVIPCTSCKYFIRVNEHWWTCERERLMNILMPKYRKQVDDIEKEFISRKRFLERFYTYWSKPKPSFYAYREEPPMEYQISQYAKSNNLKIITIAPMDKDDGYYVLFEPKGDEG